MSSRDVTVLRRMLRPEESAIESVVTRYQRVSPALTRFARTLSGNDQLRVLLGSHSSSSPDEVVCDPRLFQAAYNRDAPVTVDEVALASALHEVVHLVSSDFDERRPLPPSMGGTGEGEPVDLLAALAEAGGPVAETLFFALEDARQEAQGLAVYPGARSVLADLYRSSLPAALSAAGPLGHFTLACFLLVGDYAERDRLERRLHPPAALAMDDAGEVLEDAAGASDSWQVAGLALELLRIARAHGLLTELVEDPTSAQRRVQERHDAEGAAEGLERVRLASPIVQDTRSYTETRRAAESRADAAGRKGASELGGDPAADQLLRVSQSPTIYLPTGQGGKLVALPAPATFARFAGRGREALQAAARSWGVAQRQVSGELLPLFAANQRRGLRSGYDQGDVSPHAALFLGAGLYQRMYERRSAPTRRTYAVSLLVDASASMLQPRGSGGSSHRAWGMAAALMGAWTLARLADELQIDFEVALFNRSFAAGPADTEWTYGRSRSGATAGLRQTQGAAADRLVSTVNHYLVKPFGRRWRDAEDVLAGLFWTAAHPADAAGAARRAPRESPPVSMFDRAANVDEFNLVYAAQRMGRLGAQVRVLIVLADGMTRGSVSALAGVVRDIEQSGTTVLGIGIGDDTVTQTYQRHQVVARPADLTMAMVEGTRSALRRGLALHGMDTWWSRPARAADTIWKEPASA
jgi:hypothetical protein